MRTIWLHAGIRKAGSTAIQDFLCKNKKKLFESGYYYPTNFHPEEKKSLINLELQDYLNVGISAI